MEAKNAYQQKIEARIDEWNAEMDKLRARAERLEAEGRIEAQRRLLDIQARRDAAEAKLADLKKTGDAAWRDLTEGVDRAVQELGDAVKKAASKFSGSV
jgi:hypothetical protein